MLTQERLLHLLQYDPSTGVFTNRVQRAFRCPVGAVAGGTDSKGYHAIKLDGVTYRAQRLAFLYMLGRWPDPEADHENRNKLDNRWENLREADRVTQMHNQPRRRDNTSGASGVQWHKRTKRWRAVISIRGKRTHLGSFLSREAAAIAYAEAKRSLLSAAGMA